MIQMPQCMQGLPVMKIKSKHLLLHIKCCASSPFTERVAADGYMDDFQE